MWSALLLSNFHIREQEGMSGEAQENEALPFLYCLDQAVQEENVLPLLLFSFLLLPLSVQDKAELQGAQRPHHNIST